MRKRSDTKSGLFAGRRKRRPCLVAYTLNNSQPVVCTFIADQPFFYMEDEALLEEELALDENFADLEHDLRDLKKKMDAYEKMAERSDRDPAQCFEEFLEEAENICGAKKDKSLEGSRKESILARLTQSRNIQAHLDFALEHDVKIIASKQVKDAIYRQDCNTLLFNDDLDDNELCLMIARELRRHWQFRRGAHLHPLTFHPDQSILINRAQQADLTIAMIRAAWEIQLAGDKALWSYVESSPLADLGRVFAREAFVDFRALANGKAASAVFESWFMSERCRHEDKILIQAMLADHEGYVFTDLESSRPLGVDLISALGEQPFGKNYLAPYAAQIIDDPLFTEVRDRSNANFLWFIKFERSFRETEQALQEDEDLAEDGFSPASSSPHTAKARHEPSGNPSSILSFHAGFSAASATPKLQQEETAPGTNVIHVRFGESFGNPARL